MGQWLQQELCAQFLLYIVNVKVKWDSDYNKNYVHSSCDTL